MSKIYYIANYRFPTERAHGIQVAQTCQALVKAGQEVVLLIPNRQTSETGDIFSYYNLTERFMVKKLPVIDFLDRWPNKFTFILESLTFSFSILFYLLKNYQNDYIYSRDQFSLFLLKFWSKFKLFYEIHNFPKRLNFWHQSLFKKLKFIVISNGLKTELAKNNISSADILVAPDGVNLEDYIVNKPKDELRKKLSWPQDKKIVVYTGQFYAWKGVDTLLAAAKKLPEVIFYFIGGKEKDLLELEKKINQKNVVLISQQPHSKIPDFLQAADLLVLPNTAQEKISSHYTSPMKLFEYMASNIPIIASNLPSIREILSSDSAYFFQAEDSDNLAEVINQVLSDYSSALAKTQAAKAKVKKFTWQTRAQSILNFIKHA